MILRRIFPQRDRKEHDELEREHNLKWGQGLRYLCAILCFVIAFILLFVIFLPNGMYNPAKSLLGIIMIISTIIGIYMIGEAMTRTLHNEDEEITPQDDRWEAGEESVL